MYDVQVVVVVSIWQTVEENPYAEIIGEALHKVLKCGYLLWFKAEVKSSGKIFFCGWLVSGLVVTGHASVAP